MEALLGNGPDNLVVSQDQEASNDLLEYARSWARWFHEIGYPGARIIRDRATEIKFENGCRVVAIPGGRPEAIRHYGGNVWLDEAAHQKQLYKNLAAAGPVISQANGKLRLISSVFSDADEFYQVYSGKRKGWSVHTTTIHDAIAQGHCDRQGNPIDINELRLDVPDSDIFACEYECIPLSDADSYFPTDLLDRAELLPPVEGEAYGGYDVARSARGDFSVVCEVKRKDDRYSARILKAMRGTDYDAQEDIVERYFRERKWVRMAIDATGLGGPVAERLRKRCGGASRVEEVTMTNQVKADLMTNLRSLMDQGKLALPDDRELRLDLHGIKRIIGDSTIRYDANRNERGHADRAWALALAVRAAGKASPRVQFGYVPARMGGSKRVNWKGC
jgi:phage FluMu gp28-like protein